jgi:hypothetical protein
MSYEHFNKLTPAELERLSILSEELGEAIQVIGKILRHGYNSCHPNGGPDNKRLLEAECGDIRTAMIRLCNAGDLSKENIHARADFKLQHQPYLHHQEITE